MTERNDPCHCGSGKKYKKCCLVTESQLIVVQGGRSNSPQMSRELQQTADYLRLNPTDFYTKDLAQFFLDKVEGKKAPTIKKYTETLTFLGEILSGFEADDWSDLEPDFWEEIILFDFIELYDHEQMKMKTFFTVLTEFAKWTDQKYDWKNESSVRMILAKYNQELIDNLLNQRILSNCVEIRSLNDQMRMLRNPSEFTERDEEKVAGLFLVEKVMIPILHTVDLISKEKYSITFDEDMPETICQGMIFNAAIAREKGKSKWEFCDLDCIYPADALPYIKKNFEV
ncbi:SEC-C metal-binding domain-containing protein [Fictibacillus barbaricus]|uniref:SEC-C motif-containing protein n=1 Tax=Fictibacillus barbaricus TaxID=182136 RepID=A0ABU1TWU5_9BACL|nr:SEC-C metal-binding domain-containing protein [Fictibacillus barbaricus]MDR7071678.1 hypothetical protein [Fictibacillus barbaricus]